MHTKNTLIRDLENSSINPKGTLMVHSSMKAIGEVEAGAETVIDALMEFMKDGLLLLPTHSWREDSLENGIYDYKTEPACVGIIPNLFMKRDEVLRSMHPTHSVSAFGRRALDYVKKDDFVINKGECTPCPSQSCFGSLYDEKATMLFLGAPLTTNTFLHSVEEKLQVSNRVNDKYKMIKIKLDNETFKQVKLYGHYCTEGDVSKNYDKIRDALLYKNYMHETKIGDANCFVVKAKECADLTTSFLQMDADLFVDERAVPEDWYKD